MGMGPFYCPHHFNTDLRYFWEKAYTFESTVFELDRVDSRRGYAVRQRDLAVELWNRNDMRTYSRRQGLFELGLGVHAVQDAYAHGNVEPLVHGWYGFVLRDGRFDDPDPPYNIARRVERAKNNTVGYLNKFADRVGESRAR